MNAKILMYAALKELEKVSKGSLSGTKIEIAGDVIHKFAIYSAVAAATACVIPGPGGLIAAVSQAGFIWGTYVKINEVLGISMKENVAKFIGSAVLTNIATGAVSYMTAYLITQIIQWLPGANLLTIAFMAAMSYALIYVSSLLYLKILTEVMKVKGSFDMDNSAATKEIIDGVCRATNIKKALDEAREQFKDSKADFQAAKNNPKCPYCGESIKPGQKFCSMSGMPLK